MATARKLGVEVDGCCCPGKRPGCCCPAKAARRALATAQRETAAEGRSARKRPGEKNGRTEKRKS